MAQRIGVPYLSVVAAARNDDHGGNLLRRLQIFVNALVGEANRHSLPTELVLVEWNPPAEKPPLIEAIRWPADPGFCAIRIVTVPAALHRRCLHSEAQPLYQMIAKNAGIRRATGEFILATNVDILLSDELMRFLAERRLQRGRMYRTDRHDVQEDVPVDAGVEDQLAYCGGHRLRINTREGTFSLTPEGYPVPRPADIVAIGDGIFFGPGWSAPEQRFGQLSRRATGAAKILLRPSPQARTLFLEIDGSSEIRVQDVTAHAEGRSLVRIPVPAGAPEFIVEGFFRGLRCGWDRAPVDHPTVSRAPARLIPRAARILTCAIAWLKSPGPVGLPWRRTGSAPLPAELHTNACGDFTLLHRSHWMELRGYPEFDAYSMNIDAIFCYMAHNGGAVEEVLPEPMRIYHIEHAAGSGWTPEGQKLLFDRLAAKGVPWLKWDQVLEWAADMELFRTTMVFNREGWGLGTDDLPEALPHPG